MADNDEDNYVVEICDKTDEDFIQELKEMNEQSRKFREEVRIDVAEEILAQMAKLKKRCRTMLKTNDITQLREISINLYSNLERFETYLHYLRDLVNRK